MIPYVQAELDLEEVLRNAEDAKAAKAGVEAALKAGARKGSPAMKTADKILAAFGAPKSAERRRTIDLRDSAIADSLCVCSHSRAQRKTTQRPSRRRGRRPLRSRSRRALDGTTWSVRLPRRTTTASKFQGPHGVLLTWAPSLLCLVRCRAAPRRTRSRAVLRREEARKGRAQGGQGL